jgi:3-isopropylmalate dehydratase small subunit
MTDLVYRGKAWVFGDDIDTDIITPGKFLSNPKELAENAFSPADKAFAKQVSPGDIVVAGRNFGCGSSRETAPEVLQILKVGAVVAENFARIFYRNAVAIGLPVLEVPGLGGAIQKGDEVEVDLAAARVRNLTRGTELKGRPLSPALLQSVRGGGMMKALQAELRERAKALRA